MDGRWCVCVGQAKCHYAGVWWCAKCYNATSPNKTVEERPLRHQRWADTPEGRCELAKYPLTKLSEEEKTRAQALAKRILEEHGVVYSS